VQTLALAGYLAARHVCATFFVVGEWEAGLSEEPGVGAHSFETGHMYLPVLGDLVALGHRVGNHTMHHVLLAQARPEGAVEELRANQRSLDPWLVGELRLLRAPGGAWDERAAATVEADPGLRELVGPIRWDIDGKDWEGSLYCRSDRPQSECEVPSRGREPRVRVEVTAARYVEMARDLGHGIVLMHDRVGDVGADYALRVARRVVPALEDSGFVFAAPVLSFSPLRPRVGDLLTADWYTSLDPETISLQDVDGDGRADLCGRSLGGESCARSVKVPGAGDDLRPRTVFLWSEGWSTSRHSPPHSAVPTPPLEGDLNGDGRADECSVRADGVLCALRGPRGLLGASTWLPFGRADALGWSGARFLLGDVNGDGRADLCAVHGEDFGCALAP
jgi:peptidoglycan/xylan/chitin deacetylase (PgdA/CDA1 family)